MTPTDKLAADLAGSLIQEVQQKISNQVAADVATKIAQIDFTQIVNELATNLASNIVSGLRVQLEQTVAQKSAEFDVAQTMHDTAVEQTTALLSTIQPQLLKQVQADVAQKMAQVDVNQLLKEYVDRTLGNAIKTVNFPAASIPGPAIDLTSFRASGDNIEGGVVKHFGSTGIQDSATQCILTIMDDATVVENKLVALEANIKGDLTVEGSLNITGDMDPDSPFFKDLSERAAGLVHLSLNKELFTTFSDIVFNKIKTDGIDLTRILLNGKELASGNQLGLFVTETNIQKLGHLKSLTVTGESTLGNALFVGNKRIGINTTEPTEVLDVWDQEVNVSARKLRQNVGCFGTMRNQQLVLSAGNKENITLEADGSVSIPKLHIGEVLITSSPTMPTYDAKPGTWVINSAPDLGKPALWVSLGGARWTSGGILS